MEDGEQTARDLSRSKILPPIFIEDKGILPYVLDCELRMEDIGENKEKIRLHHNLCPRFRAIAYLEVPFVMSDRLDPSTGRRANLATANTEWSDRWRGFWYGFMGLNPDRSCSDASRLLYIGYRRGANPVPEVWFDDGRAVTEADMPRVGTNGKPIGTPQPQPDKPAASKFKADDGTGQATL